MIKKTGLFMFGIILMIFLAGSVSAGLCKDSDGYYSECKPFNHRYVEDTNSKSVGDIRPDPPVFKGSYGSYRHDMYRNGDYKPNYYFGEYKTNSYPGSFNGGFYSGGYGGYGSWGSGWNSWGSGWGSGWNSYSTRYNSYYSSYYSVPYFRFWFG